jgi:hypothetical protein
LDNSEDPVEDKVNYLNAKTHQHYNENYSTSEKSSYFEDRDKVNFQTLPDPLQALQMINILVERDKEKQMGPTKAQIRMTANFTVGTTLTAKPDSIPASPAPPAPPPELASYSLEENKTGRDQKRRQLTWLVSQDELGTSVVCKDLSSLSLKPSGSSLHCISECGNSSVDAPLPNPLDDSKMLKTHVAALRLEADLHPI